MSEPQEFTVVANVTWSERRPFIRDGALVWLSWPSYGNGCDTNPWWLNQRQRYHWLPSSGLTNIRVKWVPEHLRDPSRVRVLHTRERAEIVADHIRFWSDGRSEAAKAQRAIRRADKMRAALPPALPCPPELGQ